MASNGDAEGFPFKDKLEIPLNMEHGSGMSISNIVSSTIPWKFILYVQPCKISLRPCNSCTRHISTGNCTYQELHWFGSILSSPSKCPGKIEAEITLTKLMGPFNAKHEITSTMQSFTITYNQKSEGPQMSDRKSLAICACGVSHAGNEGVYTAHFDISWRFNVLKSAELKPGDPSPNDPEYVIKKLESLTSSKKLADMVFVVGEEEVPAHRAILGAMSRVFSSMFECDSTEKKTGRVEIKDSSAVGIRRMIRSVYTSREPDWSDTSDEDLLELVYVAHKYELQPLLAQCTCRMIKVLCEENVCKILKAASTLNLHTVMDPIADFIKTNKIVLESNEWKSLEENNPSIAFKMVRMLLGRCL